MPNAADHHTASAPAPRRRWIVVALLFAATVINYVDRQMIGVLKAPMSKEMGWSEADFANVIFWFQVAYAIGYLGFGKVVDFLGARIGYAVAFSIWQLAHIAHGAAAGVTQVATARFALGIGESGNYPSGVKAVTEWFRPRERAFAIGLFNAGSNVGAIITPLFIPVIVATYGWRAAFVATGLVAFLWLVAWLTFYRPPTVRPARRSPDEDGGSPHATIGMRAVLRRPETYAYAFGRFCIDPIWWFFLFWLPGYLSTRYGLDLLSFGPPLAAIYLISDAGSIAGGWSSSRLIRRGWRPVRARKVTMLVCAVAVLPIYFAQDLGHLWTAVLVIGVAAAAHQAFSANLYALPADYVPASVVGTVIGIGGTAGAVGGMLMAKVIGWTLTSDPDNYRLLFGTAAVAYLVGLGLIEAFTFGIDRTPRGDECAD